MHRRSRIRLFVDLATLFANAIDDRRPRRESREEKGNIDVEPAIKTNIKQDNGSGGEGEEEKEGKGREKDSLRETILDQSPLSVAPSSMRRSSRNVTSVAYVETRLSGDVGRKSSERSL